MAEVQREVNKGHHEARSGLIPARCSTLSAEALHQPTGHHGTGPDEPQASQKQPRCPPGSASSIAAPSASDGHVSSIQRKCHRLGVQLRTHVTADELQRPDREQHGSVLHVPSLSHPQRCASNRVHLPGASEGEATTAIASRRSASAVPPARISTIESEARRSRPARTADKSTGWGHPGGRGRGTSSRRTWERSIGRWTAPPR